MNCCKPLLLAQGLLCCMAGCTYPIAELRLPPPPEAKKPPEELPHKASTYVAFGNLRASAISAKETTPAQQKQYREEAMISYAKAIEVDPQHMPAYAAMARLQQDCNNNAGALAVYEQALKVNDKDASLWYEMGMCQCRLKNWAPAVDSLGKACKLDPQNPKYGKTLGLALARTGRYQDSFNVLCQYNGEMKAHIDLARMLKHLNQPDQARRHVMAALLIDPSQPTARALLAELQPPAPQGVQTASYATSGGKVESSSASPMRGPPIPVPPLPTISIRSKE
jgi:tetratricopeptide (TPR) repeat protein